MKKKLLCFLAVFTFSALSGRVLAVPDSLIDCYKLALLHDPTFKAAREQWMADRENIPIARASLLPQIGFRGSLERSDNQQEAKSFKALEYYNDNSSYGLSLSQPIFNYAAWASLWGAQAGVKASTARFLYANQDLMIRLSTAYFNILETQDVLFFTRAEKKAIEEQLTQTKHKYEVGLVPITEVNEAQASYDTVVADEIKAQKDLADRKEELREITGPKYPCKFLNVLDVEFPLIKPDPEHIESWVSTAEQQNYLLLAARYDTIAAKENIKLQNAGHLPTLDVTAGYNYNYNNFDLGDGGYSRNKTSSVGLSVNMPIFSGGRVIASVRQASYLYQKVISNQEFTHRNIMSNTRQSYLGVIAGIESIKARKQEVKSKQSSLRSTRLSYEAGMRTILDVLDAERDLYNAKKNLAISEYYYIKQTLALKEYAGILSAADLQKVNTWLLEINTKNHVKKLKKTTKAKQKKSGKHSEGNKLQKKHSRHISNKKYSLHKNSGRKALKKPSESVNSEKYDLLKKAQKKHGRYVVKEKNSLVKASKKHKYAINYGHNNH